MHLGSVHVHSETKLNTNVLDVLKTLLVVGSGTTDPDLDLVLDKKGSDFSNCADNTLESGGDVGEVGNTTTDEENLALGVLRSTEHKIEDSASVVEGLSLSGSTGVFTIIGKLVGKASRGDGISIHDGSTTTSDESPYTARGIENGELERSTSLCVHLSDVSFLFAHLATEWSRELHWWTDIYSGLCVLRGDIGDAESVCAASNSPFGTALELSSLIDLGSKIEKVNRSRRSVGVGNDNEGVDLEVAALMLNRA
jgi:hypothetical protein